MGVTLHYRGTLDDLGRLPALCDELADIAQSMGWETFRFDDDFNAPVDAHLEHRDGGASIEGNLGLKGICLSPGDGCETLWFCFDRDGNLRTPMGQILLLDGTIPLEETWAFTKTQFASPELHMWIVGLLKHLKKHYIANLEVRDEGGYWETGDEAELRRLMNFIQGKIASMSQALQSPRFAHLKGKSAEEIAAAIEQLARRLHDPNGAVNPPDGPDAR
jgi:hypothetical protein